MATIAETYLDEEPADEHGERPAQPANVRSSLDQFAADQPSAGQSVSEPAAVPPARPAAGTSSASERKPDETPPVPTEPAAIPRLIRSRPPTNAASKRAPRA